MADTKISDLTAIAGASLASTDLTVVVDVSDTTMAASGTDKKTTVADLATAVASVGALATDAEVAAAVSAHAAASDPHGDRAFATSAVSTHEADTTSVHGITDTSTLYRSGGTDVAVADGGTGSSTAAGARANLGLVIGTDVQAYDADLTALAAISGVQGDVIYHNGTAWTRLAAGTSGQFLKTQGAGANPVWAAAGGGGSAIAALAAIYISGKYTKLYPGSSSSTTYAMEPFFGTADIFPVWVDRSVTWDRIGFEVTTAVASTTCRVAIYDSSSGAPGSLVLDCGTAATDTTGVKEITISQALSAGLYWAAIVQSVSASAVSLRAVSSPYNGVPTGSSAGLPQFGTTKLMQGSITGAFPGSLTPTYAGTANHYPAMFVRAA